MVFVHANFAARRDDTGALQYDSGSSCTLDLRRVHQLRETYPSIAVGRRTFEIDRPRLTARVEHLGRSPSSQPRRFILTRSENFEAPSGFEKIVCPDGDLKPALEQLTDLKIQGLLIESGPMLLNAALAQEALNALTIYLRGPGLEEMLFALKQAFPFLPRRYDVEPLGVGALITFDLLDLGVNPFVDRDDSDLHNFGNAIRLPLLV